jgi:putative ATPase
MHYDVISAFIKSVRGSDPNAAVYYLARMLDGGEDPLFIARRLCILAAEDVGLANPNALLLANSCFQIVHSIGMPEARIPLAECAIYLASSPKSNSAYMAINEALAVAKETQMSAVPLYLRNAPTQLMEQLGYGDGYRYAHDYPGHFADLEFMPAELSGKKFYEPADNKHEEGLRTRLEGLWPKYYGK